MCLKPFLYILLFVQCISGAKEVIIFVICVLQELKELLERHKAQNESWLRARAEENDKERKELCKLRVHFSTDIYKAVLFLIR